jgi:AraC-like DNA-binding protein
MSGPQTHTPSRLRSAAPRTARADAPPPAPVPPMLGSPALPMVVHVEDPVEQRMSFRAADSWCRLTSMNLRSGLKLDVTRSAYAQGFSMGVVQPPQGLEFVVSRGSVLLARTPDGTEQHRGGNTVQLGRTDVPLPLVLVPQAGGPRGEARTDTVAVSLDAARLCELLGVPTLPPPLQQRLMGSGPTLQSMPVTPRLLRLMDDVLNTDVKGLARHLWHEAKALELLALMADDLLEDLRDSDAAVDPRDVERLERARRTLVGQLAEPPTLAALARTAGLSETRFKANFRALFGAPVFAYLRTARMEHTRGLLAQHHLNVTEVALRVGYANPSKFAAAFRRHFGRSPSSV